MSRPKTMAEQQIELLRQLKEAKTHKRPALVAQPVAVSPMPDSLPMAGPGGGLHAGAFELVEAPRARTKAPGPSLPLSRETWKRLKERQARGREFPTRKAMGEWACALLLALPEGASRMDVEARMELFKRLREWAEARGLR